MYCITKEEWNEKVTDFYLSSTHCFDCALCARECVCVGPCALFTLRITAVITILEWYTHAALSINYYGLSLFTDSLGTGSHLSGSQVIQLLYRTVHILYTGEHVLVCTVKYIIIRRLQPVYRIPHIGSG